MRIRIGNYVAGINANKTEHAIFGRFMFGKVADTWGVLNSIKGSTDQMFFADFDHANYAPILLEPHLSDVLLFRSCVNCNETVFKSGETKKVTLSTPDYHYFIISPFHYEPKEIRLILANYCGLIDPKFVGVYMRDGVNAIRLIPKQIGSKQSRQIEFIGGIPMVNQSRKAVWGMDKILYDNFKNYNPANDDWEYDNSKEDDITIREYETIRW